MRLITIFMLLAAGAWGQIADVNYEAVIVPPIASIGTEARSVCLIDADGERGGTVMILPKSGSITHIHFVSGDVTVSQTLKLGIYTVDSSNNPTTDAYGSMVAGTQTSPAASTYYRVGLSTPATATAGNVVAAMFDLNAEYAGVIRPSHSFAQIFAAVGAGDGPPWGKCYTGTWATTARVGVAVEYSDGTVYWGRPGYPVVSSTIAYVNVNSGTTNPHRGNRITPKYSLSATAICAKLGTWAASSSAIFRITNEARTTLASTAVIAQPQTSGDAVSCFDLTTPVTLSANTKYYVFSIPQSADNTALQRATRITSAESYIPTYNDFVEIVGDQSSGFTEANGYHWAMWVRGVRVTASGGFTTVQ